MKIIKIFFKIFAWSIVIMIILAICIGAFSYTYYRTGYDSIGDYQRERVFSGVVTEDIIITDSWSLRRTGNTFMSIPEWYIVSISDDYATWLERGKNPSEFPYFQYLKDYWVLYGKITSLMDGKIPRDYEYHTMVQVIGVSTTLEFGLKSLYELTIGRVTSLFSFTTKEDQYYTRISRNYVDFILFRPWYEFDYGQAFSMLHCELSSVRSIERCGIYSLELFLKRQYAKVIEQATHNAFATPDLWTEIRWAFPNDIANIDKDNIKTTVWGIKITRYYPFTQIFPQVVSTPNVEAITIAGNKRVIVEQEISEDMYVPQYLFRLSKHIDDQKSRVFTFMPVSELGVLANTPWVSISHIYDF
jgi:hypothetical protein